VFSFVPCCQGERVSQMLGKFPIAAIIALATSSDMCRSERCSRIVNLVARFMISPIADLLPDLIVGKRKQTAIGTLVEGTTRYTIPVPLKAKDAESIRVAHGREAPTKMRTVLKRQYFPKGTYFPTVSLRQLKRVQRELIDRPRAVFNCKKPDQVINQLVALKV